MTTQCWYNLCENPAPWADEIIKSRQINHAYLCRICRNPARWAEQIVMTSLSPSWRDLCRNPSQWAKCILFANIEKRDKEWYTNLCINPAQWAGEIILPIFRQHCHRHVLCANLASQTTLIEPMDVKFDNSWLRNICTNPAQWTKEIILQSFKKFDKFCWYRICRRSDPWVEHVLSPNLHNLDEQHWWHLCRNTSSWVGSILLKAENLSDRCMSLICENPAPWVKLVLQKNTERIGLRGWRVLCANPEMLPIVQANVDKLERHHWMILCKQSSPHVAPILLANMSQLRNECIPNLCKNPSLWAYRMCLKYGLCSEGASQWDAWLKYKKDVVVILCTL